MTRLDLSILGSFQIAQAGAPVDALGYDKVRALLVFLAVEGGRAHRREALAGMFWPEQDEAAARHSLSQAIWSLRKAIETGEADSPLLLVTRVTVQLNSALGHWLDVDEFRRLIDECAHHAHRRLESCRACAERLERAVALYRGGFLEGFTLADSLDFDDWVTGNREELRRQAHQAIAVLIDFHHQRGNYDRSASYARRLLALDPWDEGAHRGLMRALAASGRRAAALAEYERFRQSLADELGVHPEQETTDLHEWIRAGSSGSAVDPAGGSQTTRTSSLPPLPGALIGRRTELARIADLVGDPHCRLITLTGPGGIGKTSLAIQAAADAAADFAGGACFIPLAGLRSASLLPAIIAEALSLSFYGSEDLATQLVRYLQSRELLLVLDNFEHLIEESSIALISAIGRDATGVQLLVTSRERLRLQSEWVIDLQGLPLPAGINDQPESEDDGAFALFVQRARRARWDFEFSTEDVAAASRICRLVDGVPLGIELAAAWVPILSASEIAEEIEHSFDFLSGSARDLPDRHRSMRAVIDSSWSMLPPHEQRTLARLSVFRGGFTRAAAEDIADASLTSLMSLVDKSLLRSLNGRYEVHELLRQYAEERLDTHANTSRYAHRRHGEHFLRLVARSEAGLRGWEQSVVLATLSDEIENIRAAWRWAVDNQRFDSLAPATHGLWLFSDIAGRYLETSELLAAAIDAMERQFSSEPDHGRDLAYGRLMVHRGSFYLRTGNAGRARDLLERGIAMLGRLDAPADLGIALNFRAMLAHQQQDYEQERIALQESIDEFAAAGDRWGMAYSLNDLGIVSLVLGDTPAAEDLCRRSLDLFVTIGDQRGTAFALRNLGVIASRSGDFQRARTYLRESVTIRDAIGHRWGVADAYIQLGIVARDSGDQSGGEVEARACLVHARDVALEVQATDLVREALSQLATLQAASALPGTAA